MTPAFEYFKVSFPTADAMQTAAEKIRIFGETNPRLFLLDPPLVLWTDADIFVGVSLYTTEMGVAVIRSLENGPSGQQVSPGEIPTDAIFVAGDDRHRSGLHG